jgi:lipopolysaccharide heptosyltransferase II
MSVPVQSPDSRAADSRDWQKAETILCVRLDAVGDLLMTTPAIRAIKETSPSRRVVLLTSPAAGLLSPMIPEIDDCLTYDAPWMKAARPRADSRPELAMMEKLRERRFDAAVIFTVYSQSPLPAAFLCMLSGIPRRLAHCRENPYQMLTDWVQEPEPNRLTRHEVRRQLDLAASVGCLTSNERLSLRVPRQATVKARNLLEESGIRLDGPWVLVHPGASAASRRYPWQQFAQATDLLASEHGLPIIFSGDVQERALIADIRGAMCSPSYSLAGALDLPTLAALISLAPVLITNNTGPAHMAAATGTPVVDLYALTNPQHTPWAVPQRVLFHDVPCKYCYKSVCPEGHQDCLAKVPPAAVVHAALELLELQAEGSTLPDSELFTSMPAMPGLVPS